MADSKVSALPSIGSIDRASDLLYVVDVSSGASVKATVNAVLGITGDPVGTSDSQTISGKIFTNTNILTIKDNNLTFQDNDDTTKQFKFQASGITPGATRVFTLPDYNATLATLAGTETLTGKTLTSPVINTPTIVNPTIQTDAISEYSAAAGVTIDGLLIKDGLLPAGNIQPLNLASGAGSSWVEQSWIPTFTNVSGGTLTYAKYIQIGKELFFRLKYTLTGANISGAILFTPPLTLKADYSSDSPIGTATLQDTGTASYEGVVTVNSTTSIQIRPVNAAGTYAAFTASTSSTVPHTWASGDFFECSARAEVA